MLRSAVREYELYDARKLLAAVDKYWSALVQRGATEERRERFRGLLGEAEGWDCPRHPARVALDNTRLALCGALELYRDAAGNVVRWNPRAGRALKVPRPFPQTDSALFRYCEGLDVAMRRHSARLGAWMFTRDRQKELVRLASRFREALEAMPSPEEEGAQAMLRQAQLAALREMCRYFRKIHPRFEKFTEEWFQFERRRMRPNPLRLVSGG